MNKAKPPAPRSGTTEAKWLAAIRADPADNTPRLQYGAWLKKRDNPRGEFIEAQIRRYDQKLKRGERNQWARRSEELLKLHGTLWQREAGLESLALPASVHYWRGFIASFAVRDLDVFFDHAARIWAMTPVPEVKVPFATLDFNSGRAYDQQYDGLVRFSPTGQHVLVSASESSETESGRVSYLEGTVYHAVWRVSPRQFLRGWENVWYSSDADPPQDVGTIALVEFTPDSRAVVVKYTSGEVEKVDFGETLFAA